MWTKSDSVTAFNDFRRVANELASAREYTPFKQSYSGPSRP